MEAVFKKPSQPAAATETARPSREEAKAAVRTLIAWAGDNPDRAGLVETPERVIDAFDEFYEGYRQDPAEVLNKTFDEIGSYDDIVLVRDIPVYSHCEHHMVPFIGKAHVAYLPNHRVVGLSKLARVVEVYARRLQIQEKLTVQIAEKVHADRNSRSGETRRIRRNISRCWRLRECLPSACASRRC